MLKKKTKKKHECEWIISTPTYGVTDAAVGLCRSTTATVTLIIHGHLQAIFEAHRFDGEALVTADGRAAPRLHAHVKWHLQERKQNNPLSFEVERLTAVCIVRMCDFLKAIWCRSRCKYLNLGILFVYFLCISVLWNAADLSLIVVTP